MPILQGFELSLVADDVLRAQGGEPAMIRSRSPFLVEVAERALAEGVPLLRPAVLYRQLPVKSLTHERLALAGGGVLSGPLIGQHLASVSQVVVIVCTVGQELEKRASEVMAPAPQYGPALDGLGSAAVEALAAATCYYFETYAESKGLKTTIPLGPGMVGCQVYEGQHQILSLLNPEEIGVKLMPSGMMFPRKSLSLVIGLGADVSDGGSTCDYCSMRETCRYRSH